MYLSGAVNRRVSREAPANVGYMLNPFMGNRVPDDGRCVGLDNSCFNDRFSARRWRRFLLKHYPIRQRVLFAVVPDVYGDAEGTLGRWRKWAATARLYGMPLAFVAQDGCTAARVPWDECQCLFIGGTDGWKYDAKGVFTPEVVALIQGAKMRGKEVHAGRVNSAKRLRMCVEHGVDSCDGTYLINGPDTNFLRLTGWLVCGVGNVDRDALSTTEAVPR